MSTITAGSVYCSSWAFRLNVPALFQWQCSTSLSKADALIGYVVANDDITTYRFNPPRHPPPPLFPGSKPPRFDP